MSWEDINKKGKEYHDEKVKRLTQLCRSIFTVGEGKEFLDLLKDFYAFMPIIISGSPENANAIREGEVGFVRKLILMSEHQEDNKQEK